MQLNKKIYWTLIAGIALFGLSLSSCGDDMDQLGALKLNFKLNYQGQPLVMTPNQVDFNGIPFKVSRVSFFISEMKLSGTEGQVDLKEVDYINLTDSHADLAAAQKGYDYLINDVPIGQYNTISFNLGLTDEMNAKAPSDYSAGSILADQSEYCADWGSYIYIKIEGLMDFDGDGIFNDGITMHLGSNDAMVAKQYDHAITIKDKEETQLNFTLDLYKVFDDGSTVYDFEKYPRTHTLDLIEQIKFVAQGVGRELQLN